jgi:hypothetical protein
MGILRGLLTQEAAFGSYGAGRNSDPALPRGIFAALEPTRRAPGPGEVGARGRLWEHQG